MMFLIGRNFFHGLDPLSMTALANQLYVPEGLVKDYMETFRHGRLVLPVADARSLCFSPRPRENQHQRDPRLREEFRREKTGSPNRREVVIDELLEKVDDSVAHALEGKSLQSLIVEQSPPSP